MGVMECSRNGCDHILCECYSHTYGYLCYDCLCELKQFVKTSLISLPHATIPELIEKFMDMEKDEEVTCCFDVDEYINREFGVE